MKRLYIFSLTIILASCFSEDKVDIGNSDTFIRYFNGGYNEEPVTIAKTIDNGYIILSNITLNDGRYKIKLIKTDHQGNTQLTSIYPAFNTSENDPERFSQRAFGLLVQEDGNFVLAGENIVKVNNSNRSQMMIMTVNDQLVPVADPEIYPSTSSVRGIAISENTHPDSLDADEKSRGYIVLGSILNEGATENMVVGGIRKSDLKTTWVRSYGSGESTLTNKIFLDSKGDLFFGGTVTRQNNNKVRLVKTRQDFQNTDFDLAIGDPQFNEFGNDICRYGFGFAVIGNTNKNGDRDIFFQRLAEDGRVVDIKTFKIHVDANDSTSDEVPGNKTGDALSTTNDGGLLLAGTVPSNESLNFGSGETDLYLIKINAFGDITWQKAIGSRNADRSVAVLQADDGGYVVLAGTTLAGLKTIMLLKTDNNGNIQ